MRIRGYEGTRVRGHEGILVYLQLFRLRSLVFSAYAPLVFVERSTGLCGTLHWSLWSAPLPFFFFLFFFLSLFFNIKKVK